MQENIRELFDNFFSNIDENSLKNKPCRIEVEEFFKILENSSEKIQTIDIRTQNELNFTEFKYGNVLNIPMNLIFKKNNLDKLSKNKLIIVLCHTGTRAIAVTTLLNILGYNSKTLKGGWVALADYLKP